MLLVCIFSIIILGIIIVKRPRTIIWMLRYIRNKLLLLLRILVNPAVILILSTTVNLNFSYFCVNISSMLNTFHMISLSYTSISLFLFHSFIS